MNTPTTRSQNPYDVVPFVAQEKRYAGRMIIWTARSNKGTRINTWFSHLERELETFPRDGLLYVCFDFASFKLNAPQYFRQRLVKLAEHGAAEMRGRIAVAQRLTVGGLLAGTRWTSDISAAFPHMEVDAFHDRDTAIGWLVAGYQKRGTTH
jgi:hypothetical protein